jgi:hypothetical protein
MSQDLKCFFGVHRYELLEQQEVTDERNANVVGINYISRCTNCGGIKVTFVPKVESFLKFNR